MRLPLKLILLLFGWLLLAALAYQAGIDAFTETLLQIECGQALAGLATIFISLFVRGLRWSVIFGKACGNITALRYYIANLSYVTFTPLRSGDFFIMPLLKSRWNISYQISSARLLMEKIIDLLVIALCALPFFILQNVLEISMTTWAAVATAPLAIIVSAAALSRSKYHNALTRTNRPQWQMLFTLSLIAFTLEIVGGFILIDALFEIRLIDYSLLKPVSILFGILTLIPGGMGVESYTLNELFKWRGVDAPQLASAIVTVKLITMTSIVLLGQTLLFWNRSSDSSETPSSNKTSVNASVNIAEKVSDSPSKPRITVLIPNFNGGHFLAKAVQSLTEQTYQHFKIHIVDDGSQDDSLDHTEKMYKEISQKRAEDREAKLPELRIDRLPKVGITANWNRAIATVDTEFFTLLHCDDEYEPTYLEVMLYLLDRYPEAAIAHCPATTIDEHSNPISSTKESYKYLRYFRDEECCLNPAETFHLLLSGDYINCPSAFFRTCTTQKIGRFDEQLQQVQDWEYWFRTTLCGYATTSVNQCLLRYRRHQDNYSLSNARQLVRYREEYNLLKWAWQRGEAHGWVTGEPNFDIVIKLIIFDLADDLANGRKEDANKKQAELLALIPSFRTTYLNATVRLFAHLGHPGGKALRLLINAYISLTCLYYAA